MSSINNYTSLNSSFDWGETIDPTILNQVFDDLPHPDIPSCRDTQPFFLISPIANRTPTRPQLNESIESLFVDDFYPFDHNLDENNQEIPDITDEPPKHRPQKRLLLPLPSTSETPLVESLPKRARTTKPRRKSKSVTEIPLHNIEVSYAIALHLLLMNKTPNQTPNNITVAHWNHLTRLATANKLVQIVSRSPFVVKVDGELEHVYHTFARFGRASAMELTDNPEAAFEQRKKWWSESRIFGPISISKPQAQSSNDNWIYANIELPQEISALTQNCSSVETLAVISKILGDALQLTLQSFGIRKVFEVGAETQQISTFLPLDKAIQSVTIQPQFTSLSSQTMLQSASNPTAMVEENKYQNNFNTLVKFLALAIIFSNQLPNEKPAYLEDNDVWENAVQLQNSSSLISGIMTANAILSFTTPYFYSEYCRRVALGGINDAMKSRKIDTKKTCFRWWSNAKALFPFIVNSASANNTTGKEIKLTVTHTFTLPPELSNNPSFNRLAAKDQLNVMCKLFRKTLEKCLPEKTFDQLLSEGFVVKKRSQKYSLAINFPETYKKCILETIEELERPAELTLINNVDFNDYLC